MPGRVDHAEDGPSRKRARFATTNGEVDSDVDVQEARSNLRGDGTKRARISEIGASKVSRRRTQERTPDSADIGNDDEPSERSLVDKAPSSPPKTQYDELRDGNFEHLTHEKEDDVLAEKWLKVTSSRSTNMLGDNAYADNAILESITCINFMCHERLHCDLGPLLNFIVGENGSGKSAVLTAITLCLGGKASSTNRGGSLKSFIKEGTEQARLIVKIKNKGHDAYRPEVYGESIIVERSFSKKGTSGFKVKSATGQVITTKRQEIEEIVEYYALQVDNPLNVLSQDNARQFLNASTKAQKYQFFVDGVQLQQLDNDYRLINENLENMIAKVPDQEARLKHAENELSEAKRKKEAIEGNHQIRVKHRILRGQLVWAQVEAEERALKLRQEELAAAHAEIAAMENTVEGKRAELEAADEKLARLKQGIEDAKTELKTAEEEAQEAERAYTGQKEVMAHLLVEEREAKLTLENAENSLADTQKKIEAEERRLEGTNGQAHSNKLQELEKAKKKVDDITKELEENKAAEQGIKESDEDAEKRLGLKSRELDGKKREIVVAEGKISSLDKNLRSKFDGYEAKVPDLLRMISDERRFRDKPIGPLGVHVKLLKPQWSAILESTLGRTLNGFLVTNNDDSRLLRDMMKHIGIRDCPVFLSRGRQQLDLRGKEPDESFETILRVLKFDNNLVRDQLILNNLIEQVVLTPDRQHAEQIMFDGSPPRNVKAVLCFQSGNRGHGLRLTENNGNLGSSPVRVRPDLKSRMHGDTESETVFLKEQLRQLEVEYRTIDAERRRLLQEVARWKKEKKRNEGDRKSLEVQLRKARVDVEHVEAELDMFEGVDGRLQGLKDQLQELTAERDHHGMQFGTLRRKKEDHNAVLEGLRSRKRDAKAQLADANERLKKVQHKHNRVSDARRVTLTEVHEGTAHVDILKEQKLPRKERAVQQQQQTVDEFTEGAKVIAPTRMLIPDGETYDTLNRQYDMLTKRLKQMEKEHGNEAEINQKYIEASNARKREAEILQSILQVNQRLKQTLRIRLDKWRMFQRHITAQSRCNFQYLLAERGFRGKLLFDHRRKFLDIHVEPDRTVGDDRGRSTKTLSGGEKSFSSICLLLSIWEAMGSPLRCLDEFDVFMDNVNRAVSTNMLVTAARRSVNRQYIFITPNAIEGRAKLDKDVHIVRLGDPRQPRIDE
ncbi:P-loop containing nucleoside triphosphate hydrolase protein [Immersiella caudata]|uniref:P-loop containing nucleoside triphosphate hydrolase protein n=1 Tax=Immersiella caudata TaxID=314043 RepID=A0AA39T1I0_9PEZI|nr:P-loop containing nucleoside triphosphate hydrolase protein [Immersiella caudata]